MAFLDNVGLRHLIARLGDLVGKKNGIAPLDWQAKVPFANLPEMIGAEEEYSGATGTVPTPQPGDQEKFLKGNGTWADIDWINISLSEEQLSDIRRVIYTPSSQTDAPDPTEYPAGTIWLKQK